MEFETTVASPPAESDWRTRPARPGHLSCWFLACWVLVVFGCASLRAVRRPLWYDELFTFHLSRLPTLGTFWAALASGVDLNPPLHYLAVRESMHLLGPGTLAIRLPSIVGFVVMGLCVYRFVARRLHPVYAWAAATFPLITSAYDYAFEARPYGLVLGFAGLALVGWQAGVEGSRRVSGLILMTLALAAAVSSHFFAVLIFLPIGIGELARTWGRRRIDLPLWVALSAGLIPLAFFREIIEGSARYKQTFWSKPSWAHNVIFYRSLVEESGVPLLAVAVILAIASRFAPTAWRTRSDEGSGPGRTLEPVPLHEMVAAIVLFALPFLGFLLARVVSGGGYTERYALPAVLGFGFLLAYGGARLRPGRNVAGTVMALVFFGWFFAYNAYHVSSGRQVYMAVAADEFDRTRGDDLPIVITRSMLYLQAAHELPRELSGRIVFLTQGETTDERALKGLGRWARLNVQDRDAFFDSHARFYLCGYPEDPVFQSVLGSRSGLAMLDSRRFREGEAVLVEVDRSPAARARPLH